MTGGYLCGFHQERHKQARKAGLATKKKYGIQHYREIAKLATKDHNYSDMGRKGGLVSGSKLPKSHFRMMAAASAKVRSKGPQGRVMTVTDKVKRRQTMLRKHLGDELYDYLSQLGKKR